MSVQVWDLFVYVLRLDTFARFSALTCGYAVVLFLVVYTGCFVVVVLVCFGAGFCPESLHVLSL